MSTKDNGVMFDLHSLSRSGVFKSSSDCMTSAFRNSFSVLLRLAERGGISITQFSKILIIGEEAEQNDHVLQHMKKTTSADVRYWAVDHEDASKLLNHRYSPNSDTNDIATEGGTSTSRNETKILDTRYDVILSNSLLCRFGRKRRCAYFQTVARLLKPRGVFAFIPVMASDMPGESDPEDVARVLQLPKLDSLDEYEKDLKCCSLSIVHTRDLSSHLKQSYLIAVRVLTDKMAGNGRVMEAVVKLQDLLDQRESFVWHAIISKKDGDQALKNCNGSRFVTPEGPDNVESVGHTPVMKRFLSAKLHNIVVTAKNVSYHGSAGICKDLMAQVGIQPYEAVELANCRNGQRWTTYAIPVDKPGAFEMNGAAARLGEIGDECIVLVYGLSYVYVPAKILVLDGSRENKVVDSFHYTA